MLKGLIYIKVMKFIITKLVLNYFNIHKVKVNILLINRILCNYMLIQGLGALSFGAGSCIGAGRVSPVSGVGLSTSLSSSHLAITVLTNFKGSTKPEPSSVQR